MYLPFSKKNISRVNNFEATALVHYIMNKELALPFLMMHSICFNGQKENHILIIRHSGEIIHITYFNSSSIPCRVGGSHL